MMKHTNNDVEFSNVIPTPLKYRPPGIAVAMFTKVSSSKYHFAYGKLLRIQTKLG